jgi:hypothetical protein
VQPLWKATWSFLKKLKIELPCINFFWAGTCPWAAWVSHSGASLWGEDELRVSQGVLLHWTEGPREAAILCLVTALPRHILVPAWSTFQTQNLQFFLPFVSGSRLPGMTPKWCHPHQEFPPPQYLPDTFWNSFLEIRSDLGIGSQLWWAVREETGQVWSFFLMDLPATSTQQRSPGPSHTCSLELTPILEL